MNGTYKLVNLSLNAKTGPMPAVYGNRESCPTTCGLYNKCYGKKGRTALHWANEQASSFSDLIEWISTLPLRLWRYGVVGDLPSNDGINLDREKVLDMARANNGRPVLAYTHFPVNPHNLRVIREANALGFSLNLSADSIDDIKSAVKALVPVVTYTSHNDERASWKQDGIQFTTCPNQSSDKSPQCLDCKLCSKISRDSVVVFRGHGSAQKKISGVV